MTDPVTGLRTHHDGLGDAIAASDSACCIVDIDAMIWVNDQYGHAEGDRILLAVAECLARSAAQRGSVVFRVGGDEFLVPLSSAESAVALDISAGFVSEIRGLAIPYRRTDRPSRTTLEINVTVLRATRAFADQAFSEFGITTAARDWIGECVFREKTRLGADAGIILDLRDAASCPWELVTERCPW